MNQTETFWEDLISGKFASLIKESSKGQALNCAKEVYNIMKPAFAESYDIETLYCIYLDSKNHILSMEKAFSGTINHTTIYPREIIKRVISLESTAVVISHNHPTGDTAPSIEDKNLTTKLWVALKSIDVCLHDHVIVGNGYFSFSDAGLLEAIDREFTTFLLNH